MSSSARLLKNTGMMGVAKIIHPVVSFFLFLTIAKFLGKEGFGKYTTVFAYYTSFQVLASFGFRTLLAREVAKFPYYADKYLLHSSLIVLPVSLLNIGCMLVLVYILGFSQELLFLSFFYGLAILGHALNDMLEGYFAGLQKISLIAAMFLFENMIRILVTIYLLYHGYGLFMIVYVFVIMKYIATSLYVYFALRTIDFSLGKFNFKFFIQLFHLLKPFIGTLIFVTVFWRADIMILSKLRSIEDVGIYSAAYRFFWLFVLLYKSFVISFFPVISKSYHKDEDYYHRLCRKVIKIVILICIPVILMIYGFSDKLILLLGDDFIPSVTILKILGLGILPYALSELFGHMLLASNQQKIDFWINGIKMVVSIGLHFLLISLWGVNGAAWAISLSFILNILIQFPYILKFSLDVRFKMILEFLIKLIPALIVLCAIIYFIPVEAFIVYPIVLILYLIFIWFGNIISKQDKAIIRQIWEQKKQNGVQNENV